MSQRTRKSLAETATPSTPTRVTRNKSLAAEPVSTTPQRLTRHSLVQAEAAAEVKTPTRRTRTSSVSSVVSDVSEIGSESGRVTRRSTRLSGIKLEEPAELPQTRKRTSSISSVTSETPSQSKPTTRKSIAASKGTPIKNADNDTPSVARNNLLEGAKHEDSPFKATSTRKSRKLSLTTVEENEAEATEKKTPPKLSTQQFEEITFSSDDEGPAKSKTVDRKRKSILPRSDHLKTITEDETDEIEVLDEEVPKKSPKKDLEVTQSPKNELLVPKSPKKDVDVVKSPKNDLGVAQSPKEILEAAKSQMKKLEVAKSPKNELGVAQNPKEVIEGTKSPMKELEVAKSPKSPKKELLQKHMNLLKTPGNNKPGSPKVLVNKIDATDVSPDLILDQLDTKTISPAKDTPAEKKRQSKGKEVTATQGGKSPANQKGKKSIDNQVEEDKSETDGPSETISAPSGNVKRKSSDIAQDRVTPRKSVGKSPKRKSSVGNEKQKIEIDFEEIVLDDEDEDVVMEDDSVVETNKTSEVETSKTSEVLNQSVEKGSKKRKSLEESNTESAKKRKSMETKENDQPKDSEVENDQPKDQATEGGSQENVVAPVKETLEEKLLRIRLENVKAKLERQRRNILKKKRRSEKERRKQRLLKKRLLKQSEADAGVSADKVPVVKEAPKVPVVTGTPKAVVSGQKSAKPANPEASTTEKGSEVEQRILERLLAKKAAKKEKWLKRMAQMKAEKTAKQKEEKAAAKAVRVAIYKEHVAVKAEKQAVQSAKKADKVKRRRNRKNKLAKQSENKVKVEKKNDGGKPNITLDDIVAKLDAMTKPKAVLTEKNGVDTKVDETLRGQAKSGRFWKEAKDKFSTMVKTPGLRRPHSEKEKLRAEIKHNKEMTRHILAESARAKEEHRVRRAENIKRREENAKRAEIVQVIKNPAKLKRMKKKQLRLIEKRDTLPIIEKRKAASAAAELA